MGKIMRHGVPYGGSSTNISVTGNGETKPLNNLEIVNLDSYEEYASMELDENKMYSFPENSSTMSYDNSNSGLEATNVQDAIDELSTSLEDTNNYVTKNTLSSAVDIKSYTSSSAPYTCTRDGYLMVQSGSTAGIVYLNNMAFVTMLNTATCVFIRAGIRLHCNPSNIPSLARFYPLT